VDSDWKIFNRLYPIPYTLSPIPYTLYPSTMSKRTEQINELIRQELSLIIAREIEFPENIFVTITRVKTAGDLKHARILITVLPENKTGTALEILKKNYPVIQQELNDKLVMKFVPKIEFLIDETEKQAQEIEKILDELRNSH